jgi:predicted membrane protein
MRNQGQLVMGLIIIAVGVVILFGNLFNINLWAICWPTGLILLGLWVLVRPRMVRDGSEVTLVPLGNVRRDETWHVADEEFWVFVGDIDLELGRADLPVGETTFRTYGFVADVEIVVPAEAGVAVTSTAFVSNIKAFGDKKEGFLMPLHVVSDNYDTAERRVHLHCYSFVGEVKVRRA